MEELKAQDSNLQKHLMDLTDGLSNPVHKRLLQAYKGGDPKGSMESELGKILSELLHHED